MEEIGTLSSVDFFVGLVTGLVVAGFGAIAAVYFARKEKERILNLFCIDMISSISEIIDRLEENRDRNKRIDSEFLDLIIAEIGVYGRNREHFVLLKDISLRRDVREFFTKAAAYSTQVQVLLREFYELSNKARSSEDDSKKAEMTNVAEFRLKEANEKCDRLRELSQSKDRLIQRL